MYLNIREDTFNLQNITNTNQIHEHVNYLTDLIKYSCDAAVPLKFHNKYAIQLTPDLKMRIKDRNDFTIRHNLCTFQYILFIFLIFHLKMHNNHQNIKYTIFIINNSFNNRIVS